jgi:hypothetical protein
MKMINKRVRWLLTAAAILLGIILWITMAQMEHKPLNPVRPGKTEPVPEDNRGHEKTRRDTRSAYIATPEKITPSFVDVHRHAVRETASIPSGKTMKYFK